MSNSTRSILAFLGKVVAAYGLWYVVYDLWLLPDGTLDEWLSENVVWTSGQMLAGLGWAVSTEGRFLALSGVPGLKVVNGCNGLTTIGLFIGFVAAFPGSMVRRFLFVPIGVVVIYFSNVFRVSLLAVLQKEWSPAFEWIHGMGAPAFFYLIVFGLWVVWANYGGAMVESSPSRPDPAVA